MKKTKTEAKHCKIPMKKHPNLKNNKNKENQHTKQHTPTNPTKNQTKNGEMRNKG